MENNLRADQAAVATDGGAAQSVPPHGRISSLQGLRGVAAALVVFAHAIEHAPGIAWNPIVLTGRFGVEIFFVISGFVISYVAGEGRFSPKIFLERRIWRVAPLYWTLTLVVGLSSLLLPHMYKTTKFDVGYLVKSLLFIPAALPGTADYRPIFKLGWTLNYEMFFYVGIAALFWCSSMRLRAWLITLVFGALVACSFLPNLNGVEAFYANFDLIPFIAGVWIAVLWRDGVFTRIPAWLARALLGLAVFTTLVFYFVPFEQTKLPVGHLIMSAAAISIALAALAAEQVIARWKASTWLGDISYSLYLSHMFLIGAGWAIFLKLHLTPFSVIGGVWVVILFASSICLGYLCYRFIERPLGRLWRPGGKAVAG